ncbi:hypothetical protein [Sporosarcina sp. YIM B06819]|uniref:hypothetical protein n=1 Tax=Sporosarcina sp. YIM B06819 TaxID=3081769 RepID=UPI00298D3502|nr:hypothetical protein [Sporosarcina sp. YIM B06819]
MKQRVVIFFTVFMALIFPLLTKQLLLLINKFGSTLLPEKGQHLFAYFTMDKSTYLTFMSIEATVLVAFTIYWMQKRNEQLKEKELKEKAKKILFSTLVAALKQVHRLSRLDLYEIQEYRFIRISERHFESITEIDGLSDEEILYLNNLLKELQYLVEEEKEVAVYEIRQQINRLIHYIMIPHYVQYRHIVAEPKDAFEMMDEQLLKILRKFNYAQESESKSIYSSNEGQVIIKCDANHQCVVYDKLAEKISDAKIDNKGIYMGWAKQYDEEKLLYEGEWKDYKKHGQGKEYIDDSGEYYYTSKDGIWKNGELWDGKIYDVLVSSDGELIDESIIQIDKRFLDERATRIKDFSQYGLTNFVVKAGIMELDTTEPIREVKASYEDKYGEVEWYTHYSLDDNAEELPDITVVFNNMENLLFTPDIDVQLLPLPTEVHPDEIPSNLRKYIEDGEIERYNVQLPEAIAQVEAFNQDVTRFEYAQAYGVELDLLVMNQGMCKANDIQIDLTFPEGLIVLEGEKESLDYPDIPDVVEGPLEKAQKRMWGMDKSLAAMGVMGFLSSKPLKFNAGLLSSMGPANRNYWTDLNEDELSIHCAELLHTTQRTFNGKYLLVPTREGIFEVQGSAICEEYSSRKEFALKIVVNGGGLDVTEKELNGEG